MSSGLFRRTVALALVMALAAALCGAALALEYGYTVDVEAMRALEQGCAFPVKVLEKKAVEEVFDSSEMMDYNTDALVVTVVNNSESIVSEVRVCLIVYDDSAAVVKPTRSSLASFHEQAEIISLVKSGMALEPGQSCALSMQACYAGSDGTPRFTGARALVAAYTDEAGNVIGNPDYAEWQNLAFGMSGSNVTELD